MKLTRELKKAIHKYDLHCIHAGSLSHVPNNRYTRCENMCFNENELVSKYHLNLKEDNFVMILNHWEPKHICWTVWETPYLDFAAIKEIYQTEHWRKLWDSSMLYYDNGTELILISLEKNEQY